MNPRPPTDGSIEHQDHPGTWRRLAESLAESLTAAGDLQSAALHDAVAAVPRHLLVPRAYEQHGNHWQEVETSSAEGLALVYSPTTLVTALDESGRAATSSSTKPDLMARMLEMLDLADDHHVLEIGTGTGYNAALLTHRLGDHRVFSVDVDPQLIDAARRRLAQAGYRPTLDAVDGIGGLPQHAPYERIIATCSIPAVPWAWAEQTTVGGRVLVDLKLGVGAGNLVLLHRHHDRLEGRFTARWAAFMALRHSFTDRDAAPSAAAELGDVEPVTVRRTSTPPTPWQHARTVWFLAHTALPTGVVHGMRLAPDTGQPTAVTLNAPDGSWARIDLESDADGTRTVTESGPTLLWAAVELAHRQWVDLGRPDWPRFGLTVTPDEQWIWVDSPHLHCWPLPPR